jgi:hypothetical protein
MGSICLEKLYLGLLFYFSCPKKVDQALEFYFDSG